ncbi:hypothetical protein ACGTI2_14660 [Morganella morganii]|uniref:hypothetical protein n=1 Tax=Morganella morganii TaxID=582 RepID=UPI00386D69F0
MAYITLILAFISLLSLALGLIKPQNVKMESRKKVAVFYLGVFSVMVILTLVFIPDAENNPQDETVSVSQSKTLEFKYPQMSLEEYRNEAQATRQDIVKNYLASVPFDDSHFDVFYSCLSQMSYTKNTDLKLGEVLGWCKADFDRSVSALNDRVNLDNFISKFSSFDGSYRPLEKQIKNDMNDSRSYSHESTTYRMDLSAKPPVATVITTFTGKNQYNATVKQRAVAKVDIITGDIIMFDYE